MNLEFRQYLTSQTKLFLFSSAQNFPIQGVKCLDYLDWCKVAELMKYKAHLTQEGLDQIRKIKAGMNRGRLYGNSVAGIY